MKMRTQRDWNKGRKKKNEIGLYVSDPQKEKRNPRRDKE